MTETIKLSDLIPDPNNANKGTERGRHLLETSLQQLGAGRSILLDKHGKIIAGNKTAETAGEIGIEDVEIVRTDGKRLVAVLREDLDLDDPTGDARKLAHADNRVGQISLDFDFEVIQTDLDAGLDLTDFWFDNEIEDMAAAFELANGGELPPSDAEPQTSRADELQKVWQVETGQLWRLPSRVVGQEHRLICGDCTDRAVVERVMGGEKADMVFTDPPYNVAENGRNYAADAPTQKKTYEALKNSDWDKGFDISSVFPSLETVMSEDCAVYVCTSQWLVQTIWEWMWTWSKFCFYIVWCKPNPAPSLAKRHWTWATELIPYAVRGRHTANFPDEGHALNWWEIVSPSHTTDHPTEKPIAIPSKAIEFSSRAGHLVFDGFAGSGTTIIAAENLSRQCRAVEISPTYCSVILQRYADAFGITPELIS